MLRLAAQEAEHLAQAYFGGVVAAQLWELALHATQHLAAAQPSTFRSSLGQLIAVANQLLQAVLAPLVGEVSTLDAGHFGVAEPVGYLIYLQLVLQLGKELCVVNGALVIDELTFGNLDAEVAPATGLIAERLSLVCSSQERRIAPTVLLCLAEDGPTIDLYLREHLLQPPLLRGPHVGKLVDVDQQVVGQGHFAVELISQVDVVEKVDAQLFGE